MNKFFKKEKKSVSLNHISYSWGVRINTGKSKVKKLQKYFSLVLYIHQGL